MRKGITPETEREKPVRQQNKFQLRFIPVTLFFYYSPVFFKYEMRSLLRIRPKKKRNGCKRVVGHDRGVENLDIVMNQSLQYIVGQKEMDKGNSPFFL